VSLGQVYENLGGAALSLFVFYFYFAEFRAGLSNLGATESRIQAAFTFHFHFEIFLGLSPLSFSFHFFWVSLGQVYQNLGELPSVCLFFNFNFNFFNFLFLGEFRAGLSKPRRAASKQHLLSIFIFEIFLRLPLFFFLSSFF